MKMNIQDVYTHFIVCVNIRTYDVDVLTFRDK